MMNKYHTECQSTADGSLMIRLFEYDAQIAIEDAVQKHSEVIFTFPHTTVLYLRCNKNTPSQMKVTIRVPGDSAGYEIPVVKVPVYKLEEIMEKELYFLLPFHLFRYEKELGVYENDEEQLEELREAYRQIMTYLDRKVEEKRLTAFQRWVIQETTRKVAENLAAHHRKVQEGVTEIMGGQILELECVKWWNAGMAEGKKEGRTLGVAEGRLEGQSRVSELFCRLLAQNRIEDLTRAANDMIYQEELLQEMGL